MKQLLTLVAMQLKDKTRASGSRKPRPFYLTALFTLLGCVVVTALITVVMGYLRTITGVSVNRDILAALLLFIQILSLLSCVSGLNTALYDSGDNVLLLSFPVPPNMVYLSKIVVFYLYELKRGVVPYVSLLLGFGIFSGVGFWYYPLSLLLVVALPMLPVFLGALLSIPLMLIKAFLKRYTAAMAVFLLLFAGAVIWACILLAGLIPEKFWLVAQWHGIYIGFLTFCQRLATLSWLYPYVVGIPLLDHALLGGAIWVGILAALFLLAFAISRPLYFSIAARPLSIGAGVGKKGKNQPAKTPFLGFLKKEILLTLRAPEKLVSDYLFLFLCPLVTFFLNRVFAAMPIDGRGANLQIAFNMVMILATVTSGGTASATAFSGEGAALAYAKTAPADPARQGWAKIVVNMFLAMLSCVASVVVMSVNISVSPRVVGFLIPVLVIAAWGHILRCIEFDIRSPQTGIGASVGWDNPNLKGCIVSGLILSFVLGLMTFVFLDETDGATSAWLRALGLAVGFCLFRLYVFIHTQRLYFNDMNLE